MKFINKSKVLFFISVVAVSLLTLESCSSSNSAQSRKCSRKSSSSKKVHKMAPSMAR